MQSRRLACFFIGLWLGGSVLIAWMAAHTFRSVNDVLVQPSREASLQMQALGSDGARRLLRYQASEQNRSAFETWEVAQLFIGLGFFFYLLFGTKEGKFALGMVLVMVLVVAVQRLLLTPELTAMGRQLDYAAAEAAAATRGRFSLLHVAYAGLEAGKLILGVALAVKLAFSRGGRSGDSRKQLDVVDKRDHGHVDR